MSETTSSRDGRRKMLDSLWRDARKEADSLIKTARQEAEKIRADTEKLNRGVLKDALERVRRETAGEISRIMNRAKHTSMKALLETRYEAINNAFDRAQERLTEDLPEDYALEKAFPHLLAEALKDIDENAKVEVVIHPRDVKALKNIISARGLDAGIVIQPGVIGGALVRSATGSDLWDNTVITRLASMRENPPVEFIHRLFGSESTEGPAPPGGYREKPLL